MSQYKGLINGEDDIIEYLDHAIRPLPYVKHLFLVGSRGRGNNREDSDWDIYIQTTVPVININKLYGRVDGYNIDFSSGLSKPQKKNKKI